MRKGMERRRFLKTVGVAALTGMAFDAFGSPRTEAGSGDGNSAESKMPRLFAGCCAQSYRQELLHGQITLEDFIQKAVELRLDAVDITTYYLKSTDPEYLNNLRHLAYKNAIVFSGAACGVTMVKADVAERANSLLQIKKWVDVTDRLGACHLRIFAGKPPSGASLQQAVDWVVETIEGRLRLFRAERHHTGNGGPRGRIGKRRHLPGSDAPREFSICRHQPRCHPFHSHADERCLTRRSPRVFHTPPTRTSGIILTIKPPLTWTVSGAFSPKLVSKAICLRNMSTDLNRL